jgi:hypothetical protein
LALIPNYSVPQTPCDPSASTPTSSLNPVSYSAKIISCSANEGMTEGAGVVAPASICGSNPQNASLPAGTSSGPMSCKQVSCPYGSVLNGYDANGVAQCSQISPCSGPGYATVSLSDGNGGFVPKCKRISCPPGDFQTSSDPDGSGYVGSCASDSSYFIACTPNQDWTCKQNASGALTTVQSYRCDKGGNPAKVCVEDCTMKFDAYCGCLLGWGGVGQTYGSGYVPGSGHTTLSCTQTGVCSLPASPPNCTVSSSCTQNDFNGYQQVDGAFYCNKPVGSDDSVQPNCGPYTLYKSTGSDRTCSAPNGGDVNSMQVIWDVPDGSDRGSGDCQRYTRNGGWNHYVPSNIGTVTATVSNPNVPYINAIYCSSVYQDPNKTANDCNNRCSGCCNTGNGCSCSFYSNMLVPQNTSYCHPHYTASYCY